MTSAEYVTLTIDGQLFGVPVLSIQDVFKPRGLTAVPKATSEIAGLLNLRGRVVTAIDARARLGLAPRDPEAKPMAIGIEQGGEPFCLIVDEVGEVLRLDPSEIQANPPTLDSRWASVSLGVHRLEGRLLVIMDINRMLSAEIASAA